VTNLVITGAGQYGIAATGPLKAAGLQVSNCGSGVRADKGVRIEASSITGNGQFGVTSPSIRLRSSTVTGNRTDPDCGQPSVPCADLDSSRRPVPRRQHLRYELWKAILPKRSRLGRLHARLSNT
jgi:hypothetical protein